MSRRFRKKPVEVDALQWTGENGAEVAEFASHGSRDREFVLRMDDPPVLEITTLEGVMTASVGDWIIRGVQGEHYPCKPDIFEATYDKTE